MTDLIERLREYGDDPQDVSRDEIAEWMHKAADRIEQLEAELQAQRESTDIFRKLASPKAKEPEVAFKHDIFGAKQKNCTTDGCEGQAIDHIIMGGIGSDYCMKCADKIIAQYGERT